MLRAERGWRAGPAPREPLREDAADVPTSNLLNLVISKSYAAYIGSLSQRRGQQCQLRGVDWGGYDAIEVGPQCDVIEWVIGRI